MQQLWRNLLLAHTLPHFSGRHVSHYTVISSTIAHTTALESLVLLLLLVIIRLLAVRWLITLLWYPPVIVTIGLSGTLYMNMWHYSVHTKLKMYGRTVHLRNEIDDA